MPHLQACNPVGHDDWRCSDPGAMEPVYVGNEGGGRGVPDPLACACARSRRHVDWIPKNVSHAPCLPGKPCPRKPPPPKPWPADGYELQTLVGGHWFSTREEGECQGDAHPGDATGCTWRLLQAGVVAKNVSCVHARVIEDVMARNSTCFAKCKDGQNPLPADPTDCWTKCVFATILGSWDGFEGHKGMQSAELVTIFDRAMALEELGGCPDVKLTPSA